MTHSGDFVEAELRVGMLDVALAKLVSADHHTIEFPTLLLPENVVAGSIVKLQCSRAAEAERKDTEKFTRVQQEILDSFATNLPKPPVLRTRNVTQTSVVLEWDPIDAASADLHSMVLYKGTQRLGVIPSPLKRSVTKVSNLEIDQPYEFQLVLSTSAGSFESNKLQVQTHKMTDLSGVVVCPGSLANSTIPLSEIEQILSRLGSKPPQDSVRLDTTHFVCTVESGPQYERALEFNIPVVRPEWLKACEAERRLVSVRGYYLSADTPAFHAPAAPAEVPVSEASNASRPSQAHAPQEQTQSSQSQDQDQSQQEQSHSARSPQVEPHGTEEYHGTPQDAIRENSSHETAEEDPQDVPMDLAEPRDELGASRLDEQTSRYDSQGDLSAAIDDVAQIQASRIQESEQDRPAADADTPNDDGVEMHGDISEPQPERLTEEVREDASELSLEEKLRTDPEARLNPSEEHGVVVEEGGTLEPQTAAVADTHDLSEDDKETEKAKDIGDNGMARPSESAETPSVPEDSNAGSNAEPESSGETDVATEPQPTTESAELENTAKSEAKVDHDPSAEPSQDKSAKSSSPKKKNKKNKRK